MNAVVGGYVSWQAVERLKDRGLKYRPDVVLVLVGWNDLVYSSLPSWKPGLDLSQIEQAYQTAGGARGDHPRFRDIVYGHSRLAAMVRDVRNAAWNRRRVDELIRSRQVDSGKPFNEEALRLYVRNLERILQLCAESGARMALIRWPALVTPRLVDDSEVHRRLVPIYSNFPLSTREILRWYERYSEAQQEFAARHHDVLLVDGRTTFERMTRAERLDAFTDLAHLTARGNEVLAEIVLEALEKAQMPSATPRARPAATAAGETAHRQRRRRLRPQRYAESDPFDENRCCKRTSDALTEQLLVASLQKSLFRAEALGQGYTPLPRA